MLSTIIVQDYKQFVYMDLNNQSFNIFQLIFNNTKLTRKTNRNTQKKIITNNCHSNHGMLSTIYKLH